MIVSHLTGLAVLAALLLFWVAVQAAWRRHFPGGSADALDSRVGCNGCDRTETCAQEGRRPSGPRRNRDE